MDRNQLDAGRHINRSDNDKKELINVNKSLKHSMKIIKEKIEFCTRSRKNIIKCVKKAKAEAQKNFQVATGVKIGFAASGVAFGIMAIVGYSLLIPSWGAALPLAIVGTAGSVVSGLSGGGASIGQSVKEKSICDLIEASITEGAEKISKLVADLHKEVKSAMSLILQLNDPHLNALMRERLESLKTDLSSLLNPGENPSEDRKKIAEKTRKLLEELKFVDNQAHEFQSILYKIESMAVRNHSESPVNPVGNMNAPLPGAAPNPASHQDNQLKSELMFSFDSLVKCFSDLLKIESFGTAKSEGIEAVALISSSRTLVRGGLAIAQRAFGAGRPGVQTALRIVGLVSSAVFTGVDIGLTAYYSYQLHKFKQNGQSTELILILDVLIETARSQMEELEASANRC